MSDRITITHPDFTSEIDWFNIERVRPNQVGDRNCIVLTDEGDIEIVGFTSMDAGIWPHVKYWAYLEQDRFIDSYTKK